MKKLLQIGGSINYGAPGKITEQIGLLAMSKGWEVFVAHSSRNQNPSQLPHIAITSKLQEALHAFGAKFFDLHGLMSTKQTIDLVQRIKEYKPDIIHLHNIHGYFCNFKVLFEYLGTIDTPVVWTLHDCWPFTGRCFHFVGVNCYKWKTGCYECKAEAGYTVSKYYDRSKELYSLKKQLFSAVRNLTIVPVSDWQAAFLKDSFLKDCKIHTIHNGVDLDKFSPVTSDRLRLKHNFQHKYVILGVAAPWNERKGLNDFIKLRSLMPDNYSIIMVGLSQKQIKKLPQGIVGISRTESQHELAEYYSMADVFLNMTYLDTFPTVNIEALACGTPVITYRTGGSPEAVDCKTGVVVDLGSVSGVADAIKELHVHPLSSEDCRKRAETYFDKDKCFEEYIKLYDKLLRE